ncbi:MAG: TrkH family potassium uptake protein, partial [Lachnospiraceae bacterium]|nr:TrkH family potassium uptake protein [Lachnospiraceae bacterium]
MNYGVVRYILGWILVAEAIFLLVPGVVGVIYGENECIFYFLTAVICAGVGILMSFKKPQNGGLYLKEGYFVVALGWILMSMFGGIPFVMTGEIPHYMDAVFETASGFSTTGATIISDLAIMSHASLFWRSFQHLLGGMGVFVFLSALLPMLGGNSMNLMKAESTGPSIDKLVPRLKDTARILYMLYLGMATLECIILLICGLNVFESMTLTFGTVGTGGFGLLNDSIASYSPAVQWTITVFMILSGINYNLYFLLLMRKFKNAFKMEEVRLYLLTYFVAVVLVAVNVSKLYSTFSETIRYSAFQVATLLTSTGYATTDFDRWPEFAKTVLIMVMMMGACAGSTGGGIKMSRVLIMFKSIRKQIQIFIHPRAVKKIKMDGNTIEHDVVRGTNAYICVFCIIFAVSVLFISIDGADFTTNFTAVLACFNNMGPGFNKVGPTCNYAFFSDFSKLVLVFDMLAGRLELFPMLMLITPRSWRRHL